MISTAGQDQLIADEGNEQFVYDDATGAAIVAGYTVQGTPTIGVGRNLTASGPGLSRSERANLYSGDLWRIAEELDTQVPQWTSWPQIAQDVAMMVSFNLGTAGFASFVHTIAALDARQMSVAAQQLMDSGAARELPQRYQRMADALVRGAWS